MKNINRKAISFILAIAMMISLIPSNLFIFAADEAITNTTVYGEVTATLETDSSFILFTEGSESAKSTTVESETERADFPTKVKIVDYYGNFNSSFRAYKVEPLEGTWPEAYANYTWVRYIDLSNFEQEPIAEDEEMIGKSFYINPPLYDSDGYYEMLNLYETPDISPNDSFILESSDYMAVYTITDVFKTAWCELYQLTSGDSEIKVWADGLWISASDVEIITADTPIRGQVAVTQFGEPVSEIYLTPGEKSYVFTELGNQIDNAVSYQWQVLIDEENNIWADIYDYIHPYAVLSEALIGNVLNELNCVNMRCVVTSKTGTYVSGGFYVHWAEESAEEPALDAAVAQDDTAVITEDKTDSSEFQIQIDYVFNHETNTKYNGTEASSPLIITLSPGTTFGNKVTFPPEVGYQTYITAEKAKELNIQGTAITYNEGSYVPCESYQFTDQITSFHLTVYYIPRGDTQYRVRYYKQNLNDDNYTYAGNKFHTGYTHDTVADDLNVSFEGFMSLAYDKNALISGDGTTTIDIYYDREYYLVDVDLSAIDGSKGYGVVPRYVRYETPITMGEPTNPGFEFANWSLVSMDGKTVDEWTTDGTVDSAWTAFASVTKAADVVTVKNHNLRYKANWTQKTVQYTIVYWKENLDNDNYSFFTYETKNALSGDTVTWDESQIPTTGVYEEQFADIDCFTLNVNKSDSEVVVKGDGSSVINVYYRRNVYTLQFQATGACALPLHTHGDDTCDTKLICGLEAHEHTEAECGTPTLTCTIDEGHTHDDKCCTFKQTHVHDKSCYTGAGEIFENAKYYNLPTTPKNGQVEAVRRWTDYKIHYYIYINGSWYDYSGNETSGVVSPDAASCATNHTHGDGYCTCTIPEHTHINSCYTYASCTNKGHVHDNNCYSECTKIEHTQHNGHTSSNSTNIVYYITAKYQADIRNIFPSQKINGVDYKGTRWNIPASKYLNGEFLMSLDRMLGESLTFTRASSSGTDASIYYYIEKFPNETSDISLTYKQETKYFDEWKVIYLPRSGYLTYAEEFHSIEGFTQWTSDPVFTSTSSEPGVKAVNKMYYYRNSHQLQFTSNGVELTDFAKTVYYGASVASYASTEPPYPTTFESNGYKFDGWYTTPTCVDGTKYAFATETMPDADVMLFAKWIPTEWSVEVYRDVDTNGNPIDLVTSNSNVPFGSFFADPELTMKEAIHDGSKYKNLTFNGWYYMDGTEEKRFDFNSMQIKKHYVIYAKWISTTPVPYTIHYYKKGTTDSIAKSEHGVGLAGLVRVFEAKVGEELYTEYQTGWFPTMRSHGLELSLEEDKNVYAFYYKQPTQKIPVTINHTFTDDGLEAYLGIDTFTYTYTYDIQTTDSAQLTVHFEDHITTESGKAQLILVAKNFAGGTFKNSADDVAFWNFITTLSPDVYQQDLIIVAAEENADNTITFNWIRKTGTVLCEILHQYETIDCPTDNKEYVTEFVHRVEMQRGMTYNADAYWQDIPGFTPNKAASTQSVTIASTAPSDGKLESYQMILNYDRNTYEYTVIHSGTTIPDETKTAKYGTIVEENAQTPTDYYVVGAVSQTVEITSENQQIIFNYGVQQISYNYVRVGDSASGVLNPFGETIKANKYGETPIGSVPTASTGYRFVGWFTDEGCTTKVNDNFVENKTQKLTPPKPEYEPTTQLYSITYYAKFELGVSSLTIKVDGIIPETDQGFIYTIKGTGTNSGSVSMRVCVIGKGSVTITNLPIDSYTVTWEKAWSWRYNDQNPAALNEQNITLATKAAENVVTFTYSTPNDKWLSDNAVNP